VVAAGFKVSAGEERAAIRSVPPAGTAAGSATAVAVAGAVAMSAAVGLGIASSAVGDDEAETVADAEGASDSWVSVELSPSLEQEARRTAIAAAIPTQAILLR